MPLYEYECRGCGNHFEYLTRADQVPACPSCHSENLQKLLSVFAAHSDGPSKSMGTAAPCATCGDPAGSCSVN